LVWLRCGFGYSATGISTFFAFSLISEVEIRRCVVHHVHVFGYVGGIDDAELQATPLL
jgi:hypothetical protein